MTCEWDNAIRRIARIAALLAVICGVGLAAPTRNSAGQTTSGAKNAQDTIIRLENRWLANEGNPAALDSILADDFVHVLPIGLINKRQQIDFVRQHPQPEMKEHRFEKLDVRVYGIVAIANGIVLAVPQHGAPRRTYFTDVFALRDGRWQAVNAQESEAGVAVKP